MTPAAPRPVAPGRLTGIAIVCALALTAWLAPALWAFDPARQSLMDTLQAPSAAHPLGTDHLGRDMVARMVAGARLTLSLAALAVVTAAIPGVILGMVAGLAGGWTDRVITTFGDAVLALPGLLLVLVLAAIAPGSWWALYVGLSLTLWIEYFRYVRARTRILAAAPAVEASRLLGMGPVYILRRHFWPEVAPGLATIAAFGAATSIAAIAALGFIGVGLRPPTAEWGLMMAELLPYWREAPWLLSQPVLGVTLTVLALHMIAQRGPAR